MAERVLKLPTEVELPLDVMPCQAMRRTYDSSSSAHACSYFGEWGSYHSYDYPEAGPPDQPGIRLPVVYAGKTALIPEILSGCRKAPLMSVGINPNLPGWWARSRNAANPYFDDVLQYAHYFRYRSVAKLQIARERYEELLAGRTDSPADATPLTKQGESIEVELAPMAMYTAYQSLLDGLADKLGWDGHELSVGEDLSYANMVACPSARWLVKSPDPNDPSMPVMGSARARQIVRECFHERRYFLRQLFQSLPVVLLVFSETTSREFITAMKTHFVEGNPQPSESPNELFGRTIRLQYAVLPNGKSLSARVLFLPHASANPNAFAAIRPRVIDALAEEVDAGRLTYSATTKHLARPVGGCVFCTNKLYSIGPCEYENQLRPLATELQDPALADQALGKDEAALVESDLQSRLLEAFLKPRVEAASAVADALDIDAADSRAIVLKGRVASMKPGGPAVVANASLFMKSGRIVAIAGPGDPAPSGFSGAPRINTQGTIYPGLLDLHNHLTYNVLSLWQVPRAFKNRSQWQRDDRYRSSVPVPLDVLVRDAETAKAIVRYVEVKALIGGTTSAQGMRSRHGGTLRLYSGLVRNFEDSDDARLPAASGRILNLDPSREGQVEQFRSGLDSFPAYFYHLSEGIDDGSRRFYSDLFDNDLLQDSLVAIHALALRRGDLRTLKDRKCKVVWSPMSNILLYGKTLDPRWLADLKVPFSLGCDWSPTGSKNLLEEIKVAHLAARASGAQLTTEAICAAVTRNAAHAVGWGDALGTLEDGKHADILVLSSKVDDPFENLLRATERDVRMVVVNGHPRYGNANLMAALGLPAAELEALEVGGVAKSLHLSQAQAPLNGFSFKQARARLRDVMNRLQELDVSLDADVFGEPFAGPELLLDNDDPYEASPADDVADVALPASVPLDSVSVIDDPGHFDVLEAILHLPTFMQGLRAFYS
jgi:hypothetical protein